MVGTAIRNSGRATAGTTRAVPDCSTNHSSADRIVVNSYNHESWTCLPRKSTLLPFDDLTGFDIENTYSSAEERIVQQYDNHCVTEFVNGNYINELFLNQYTLLGNYFNENELTQLERDTSNRLDIFSMNIYSLPKHGGEFLVFWSC